MRLSERELELDLERYSNLARRRDYHQILGVGKRASVEELRKGYKSLAKMYHPDKFYDNEDESKKAEKIFMIINEAMAILELRKTGRIDIDTMNIIKKEAESFRKDRIERIIKEARMNVHIPRKTRLYEMELKKIDNLNFLAGLQDKYKQKRKKIRIWIKSPEFKDHARTVALTAGLTAAILLGAYKWDSIKRAFVKVPPNAIVKRRSR